MATQLTIYSATLAPFLLLWAYYLYTSYSTTNIYNFHMILSLPFLCVIALGIYALASVINGVTKFNDCPDAREELVKQIQEAKADLRKRKIIN